LTNPLPSRPDLDLEHAIRDMLGAAGVALGTGQVTDAVISAAVAITRTFTYDEEGRRRYSRGLWSPLGYCGPEHEEGLLTLAAEGLMQTHYDVHEGTVHGLRVMMARSGALPSGTHLQVAAVVTEIIPFAEPDQARYDVWWPTGPLTVALERGLLVRVLRDAMVRHDRAVH
jgi:hypothetical protein